MVKIGQRFGKLVVLEKFRENNGKHYFAKCQCDCGNIITKRIDLLDKKSSCGCQTNRLKGDAQITHGLSKTKLYKVWASMKNRCFIKTDKAYHNYGGRGISFCDEWKIFENFYNWSMNNGYQEGLTIDRINNNGNYEPNNCQWIPKAEQSRNTRRVRLITYNNETHCVSEWSRILGFISVGGIINRLNKGWSVEKTFTTPLKNNK